MPMSKAANLLIFNEQTFPFHFPESSLQSGSLAAGETRLDEGPSRFSLRAVSPRGEAAPGSFVGV